MHLFKNYPKNMVYYIVHGVPCECFGGERAFVLIMPFDTYNLCTEL